MSNVSKKRHKQPKKDRVSNVKEFARGFVASVGDKNNAQTKAKKLAEVANEPSTKNFWTNMAGVIGKLIFTALIISNFSCVTMREEVEDCRNYCKELGTNHFTLSYTGKCSCNFRTK